MEPTLEYFSTSYTALILFLVLTVMCWKADLSFFMHVSSVGVIFIMMLIIFIVITGIEAFYNTDFIIGPTE